MESMIPKDAREVYCNEQGEPIAFCPKESIGITDFERAQFYNLNKDAIGRLSRRAAKKTQEDGSQFVVVVIDVDDPKWCDLAEALMPGHDWDAYRQRGERPCARGVVPREPMASIVSGHYPAAGEVPQNAVSVLVFAAGGVAVYPPVL